MLFLRQCASCKIELYSFGKRSYYAHLGDTTLTKKTTTKNELQILNMLKRQSSNNICLLAARLPEVKFEKIKAEYKMDNVRQGAGSIASSTKAIMMSPK